MKKISTLLLIAIFVLSLSACTPEKISGGSKKAQNTVSPTQSTQSGDKTATSDSTASAVQSAQAAQNSSGSQTEITRDKAIEIALNQVGVSQNDVRDFGIELDRERSKPVWDVDFEYKNREYSFDIDATTGEILENESEYD